MTQKSICFVAGHSGGHIIPAISKTKQKLENNKDLKIIFISTNNVLDKKILQNHQFIKDQIFLPLKHTPKKIFSIFKFIFYFTISFFKSIYVLKKYKCEQIVSMGGLISIPVCIAGKLLNIPIEIYELNVEPGKTINFLSKFTKKIKICYSETQNYFPKIECEKVDYPIRFNSADKISQNSALNQIGFSLNRKTIFIVGGSQGSKYINNLIKNWIENEKNIENYQIVHQTGSLEILQWKHFYSNYQTPTIIFDYSDEMKNYYCAADLIICRSGAGTLAEILFFNKKCITIPLETKYTSHQIFNAQVMQKEYPDLFCMLKQNEIEQNNFLFFEKIKNI